MPNKPYQTEALEAVRIRKVQRGIVALPTGTGKGYIAGNLIEALGSKRTLYLAHRSELIEQLEEHVQRVLGWGKVSVDQESRHGNAWTPAVIASVPTISRSDFKRLSKLGQFDAVVCDEAHHAPAESYLRLWRYFGMLDENNIKTENCRIPLIGLTATPGRGDNVGLCNVFDEILYQMSLAKAIKDGWLVPVYAYTIKTTTNLDKVKIRMGDYSDRELAETVATEERNTIVFDAWQKNAKSYKTLIFCVNVEHAEQMAEFFTDRGVEAKSVSGKMNKYNRSGVFGWFMKTPGAVLTNCQIVTEGIDIPSVEAVIMARPTKSRTLYAQALGRGTRLAKGAWDYTESVKLGKSKMVLLDITDSATDTGRRAVNISDIFGAPLVQKPLNGEEMLKEIEEQQVVIDKARRGEFVGSEAIPVNLFAMPADLPKANMAWLDYGDMFRLSLANHGDISIYSDTLDRWSAKYFNAGMKEEYFIFDAIPSRDDVVEKVEGWVKKNYSDVLLLTNKNAKWRLEGPSGAQRGLCKRLHIYIPEGATKGDVSMAIDRRLRAHKKTKTATQA